eukprot:CAMPEP_0184655928 /NCGR_PEP_ID=MMETSP0308-20130426/14967_1 /TAXON_ID=38269 /ORGANISM="Gloeochaete witrockiana, Strain SAG 46.84" /LENGTH=186 /DNA_ID=CAMNT_0027092757 /DNA_START=202 /DNA_END=762 /DNA_ORIENTATION=+
MEFANVFPTSRTSSERIIINVGGQKFECTQEALTGVEANWFSDNLAEKKQAGFEPTELFIDRDPTYFRHILNYLRSKNLPILPNEMVVIQEVLREAEFYHVLPLARYLQGMILTLQTQSPMQGSANSKMSSSMEEDDETYVYCSSSQPISEDDWDEESSSSQIFSSQQTPIKTALGPRVFSTNEEF